MEIPTSRLKLHGQTTARLAGCILLTIAAGFIGSIFFNGKYDDWYVYLNKPSFYPSEAFLIISRFIALTVIGFTLFLVFESHSDRPKDKAFAVFALQLILSILWWIFTFGFDANWLGVIDFWLLIAATAWMAYEFYLIRKVAGFIILPILVWLCYISVIDVAVASMN